MITFVFPSDVSSWSTRDMGIADGLLKVKQIVKQSTETGFGWRQTSFLFFLIKKEPFSLRFPYIFWLLDFFFDTEYYAILMLNS